MGILFPQTQGRRGPWPRAMEGGVSKGNKKKKAAVDNINVRMALVMKSGKAVLGYKTALKSLRQGKGELSLISVGSLIFLHADWACELWQAVSPTAVDCVLD